MRPDNRKVLFTEGAWTIRKWNTFAGSFIRHEECDTTLERTLMFSTKCECTAVIPDSIMTLWRLDNFDRMSDSNSTLFWAKHGDKDE